MENEDILNKKKYIFGSIFLLANRLQAIMDKDLASAELTAKQWFLLAVLDEFFPEPPTLKELAAAMGSSHQNVKQLALKLEKNGYLELYRDKQDSRILRIKVSNKIKRVWENRQNRDLEFFRDFFQNIEEENLDVLLDGLQKLIVNLNTIED